MVTKINMELRFFKNFPCGYKKRLKIVNELCLGNCAWHISWKLGVHTEYKFCTVSTMGWSRHCIYINNTAYNMNVKVALSAFENVFKSAKKIYLKWPLSKIRVS